MTEQLSFAPHARPKPRIPYRGKAPHTAGSDTSREAAESIEPEKGSLQYEVWRYLVKMRGFGATDEQGAKALKMSGNTYRPRRRELEEMGLIRKTDVRRPTDSGRSAAVYVVV